MTATPFIEPAHLLERFRDTISRDDPIARIADGVIGQDIVIDGPFGPRPMIYADYIASGRPLRQVEQFVSEHVLPFYANTHTQASFCGKFSTRMRKEARKTIARLCGADDHHAVIFTGSGATMALNKLVQLLGAIPDPQGAAGSSDRAEGRPLVVIGPYEHHSNILPWRESGAEVVEIGEATEGGPDCGELERVLRSSSGDRRIICAFSAVSNVTGHTADVAKVTKIAKDEGALVVWDYAAAAPYVPIRMQPAPGVEIDAIALSTHKFVGGAAGSGVLIVRREAVTMARPTMPGGGTVNYVSSSVHDYTHSLEDREEAGTPNYIGDVRAALAFLVKDAVDPVQMRERNAGLAFKALAAWRDVVGLKILGSSDLPRLPFFSFLISDGAGGYRNPQLVTRVLSDQFGIQARGGCACAGPYAHRLLNIDADRSAKLRAEIAAGNFGNRPGFTRLNLSPYMPAEKVRFIIDKVAELPAAMESFADRYRYNPHTDLYDLTWQQPSHTGRSP